MLKAKYEEIRDEFNLIAKGKRRFIDALLPIVLFSFLSASWSVGPAAGIAFAAGLLLAGIRYKQGLSLRHALGGIAALLAGSLLAVNTGRSGDFLLPSLGTNGLILLLCLVSIPIRRPFVAWTSYLARHYPLAWYWHPLVRPAYSEVTILWACFFGSRLFLQLLLRSSGLDSLLFLFSLLSGWPAIVLLLAVSYVYGTWRLHRLGGPGAEEFRRGDPPPWKGQDRGF